MNWIVQRPSSPACATGLKRVRPETAIFTLQGDGDMVNADDATNDRLTPNSPTRASARSSCAVPASAFGGAFSTGESAGLPADLRERFPEAQRVRLPLRAGQRSLNLSNAVAVSVFEGWRQNGYAGGV